jgi:predicted transcriptional regulator
MSQYILMSIRSKYARKILDGSKTWEYRKNAPRVSGPMLPSTVFIYSSGEEKAIVGEFTCGNVLRAPLHDLMVQTKLAGDRSAVAWMQKYYKGAKSCSALQVSETQKYDRPLSLSELRRRVPGFRPPQSFFYIPPDSSLGKLLTKNRKIDETKQK